jgi:SAM-dependent methyltransferase
VTYYAPRYLFRRYEVLRRVLPGETFLEVGPGRLQLARDLLSYFDQGILVDFSPGSNAYYVRLPVGDQKRLKLIIGDLMDLQLAVKVNCVVACEVMEHIEDDAAFLRRLHQLLQDGGQLMLSVPAHMRCWSYSDEAVGHFRRYERLELKQLLQAAGFRNIQIVGYGYPYVNAIRYAREMWGWQQQHTRIGWSQKQRSQQSGMSTGAGLGTFVGFIVNPKTVRPFAYLARLANHSDRSEAYLATAQK